MSNQYASKNKRIVIRCGETEYKKWRTLVAEIGGDYEDALQYITDNWDVFRNVTDSRKTGIGKVV